MYLCACSFVDGQDGHYYCPSCHFDFPVRYVCICVCACVRARMCMDACKRASINERESVCVCAGVRGALNPKPYSV